MRGSSVSEGSAATEASTRCRSFTQTRSVGASSYGDARLLAQDALEDLASGVLWQRIYELHTTWDLVRGDPFAAVRVELLSGERRIVAQYQKHRGNLALHLVR